ncbi:MAG: hypothetical protein ACOYNI_12965 [Acidimicrobiia bacterium]
MVRPRRWTCAIAAACFACGGVLAFAGGRAVSAPGDISTVAGGDSSTYPFDEVWNTGLVNGIAFDGGVMYLAETAGADGSALMARNLTTQQQWVFAGDLTQSGFSGDGGPASAALFNEPGDVVVRDHDVFVADAGNFRVRKIDHGTGTITTYAGNGDPASSGDGGLATAAGIGRPTGLVFDSSGNLLISTGNGDVRMVDGAGNISTVMSVPSASFGRPAFDAVGNFYVFNVWARELLRSDPTFATVTVAVSSASFSGSIPSDNDTPLAFNADGLLLISDASARNIVAYDPDTSAVATYMGDGTGACRLTGPVSGLRGFSATAMALGPDNDLYLGGVCGDAIERLSLVRVDATTHEAVDVYGPNPPNGDGGLATSAPFHAPTDVVRVGDSLYIAETFGNRIRKVDVWTGIVTTVAGDGIGASTGDGGPASAARLLQPIALAAAPDGRALYVGGIDYRIRKIDLETGIISTFAGSGLQGFSGDGGLATSARLGAMAGIFVTADGRVYFTSLSEYAIRCVGCDGEGIISTVVGGLGAITHLDGYEPTLTAALVPWDVVVSPEGELTWTEATGARVRRISNDTGLVETVTGQVLAPGYSGDNGLASDASFGLPTGLRFDAAGNLFIADAMYSVVRKVNTATGIISTIAGTGTRGHSGDGGPARLAQLATPIAVTADEGTHIYIVEAYPGSIRRIERNRPDLAVSASDVQAVPNGEVPIRVQVKNDGDGYATGPVTAEFTLPASLAYVSSNSAGWACDAQGAVVQCEYDSAMATGAVTEPVINVRVAAGASGTAVVPVGVTSDSDDADPGNQAVDVNVTLDPQPTTTTAAPMTTVEPPPDTAIAPNRRPSSLPYTGGATSIMRYTGIALMLVAVGLVFLPARRLSIFYRPKHRVPVVARVAQRIQPRTRR